MKVERRQVFLASVLWAVETLAGPLLFVLLFHAAYVTAGRILKVWDRFTRLVTVTT